MKFKGFIRRAKRRVSLLLIIMTMMTMLTGCRVDNSKINAAVINSVLAKDIFARIQEQVSLIIDLKERHIIPDVMADGLLSELGAVIKGIENIYAGTIEYTSDGSKDSDDDDEEAIAVTLEADGGRHDFIERVLASICRFGSYPSTAEVEPVEVKSNEIKKKELDKADIYSGYYGSFINVYNGFITESLIKHSNYKSAFNLNDPRPLELFGSTEEVKRKDKKSDGSSLPTSIKGLVDYLNGLRDMTFTT